MERFCSLSVAAGEDAESGTAEGHGVAEGLALRDGDVGAHLAGRLQQAEGDRLGGEIGRAHV